jgi:hypothetical protein
MKRVFLGAAAFLIGAATPAWAQIWGATADGDYFNVAGQPGYNGNVAVNIPLNWYSVSAEIDTGLHAFGSSHDKDFGGSFIWNDPDGEFRLAATGTYNHDVLSPLRLNETPLGVGAEWYPTDWVTLGARGGGIVGSANGEYAGGALKVYPFDDLSIGGTIDYLGATYHGLDIHETDYGANAEWLVSETFPLAITGSFRRARFDGSFTGGTSVNLWSIGLRFYVNEFGAGPLVQRNRTGTLDTIGPIHPLTLSASN